MWILDRKHLDEEKSVWVNEKCLKHAEWAGRVEKCYVRICLFTIIVSGDGGDQKLSKYGFT